MLHSVFELTLPEERAQTSWKDVRVFLTRYYLLILGVFALTVVSAYGAVSMLSELYQTESSLLVKVGRENLDPPAVSRNVPLMAGLRREEVMSEMEILKAPDLVGAVVDQIGLDAFRRHPRTPDSFIGKVKEGVKGIARAAKEKYQDALIALDLKKRLDERQRAVGGIVDSMSIEPVKDSDVISLKLRMPDPVLAENIENRLIQLYLTRRIQVRSTPGVPEFLTQVAKERQSQLMQAEGDKEAWKQRTGLVSGPDQKALLIKQIRELSAAKIAAQGEMEGLARQNEASVKIMDATPAYQKSGEQQTPSPSMQSVKEKLIGLEVQRTQALSKYKPESEIIVSMNQEIDGLKQLLAAEQATQTASVTSQLNPNRQAVEQRYHQDSIRLEGLRAVVRAQTADLKVLQQQLSDIDNADAKLTDIERRRQITEQDYLTVVRRKFDSDVSTELDRERVSNVSVSMPPTSTTEPVYPRKLLIMGVALVMGLGMGVLAALILNYFDDKIKDARQVEELARIPCLGTLAAGDLPA